jgi:hypothetical protein
VIPGYKKGPEPVPKRITYNELVETLAMAGLSQRRAKLLADWIMIHGLERRAARRQNGEPEQEQAKRE